MSVSLMLDNVNILTVARARAIDESCASKPVFTYLNDGENVSGALSFSELDRQARALAAHIQKLTQPGDRVLLVYKPSLEYIVAFYSCVYAGVVAVPALVPSNSRGFRRLSAIAADSQAVVALTSAEISGTVSKMESDLGAKLLGDIIWLATDGLEDISEEWVPPSIIGTDIVFLQYTSGSTASPKGVMISHDNLIANLELINSSCEMSDGEVAVLWLPPFHDFGLIAGISWPVFHGAHCVQFPPSIFMAHPDRWLKLVSRYKASVTGAPNFAYQYCIEQISEAQRSGLDLSCLDVVINGSERIRASTMREFYEVYAEYGLRSGAIAPAYGMAESVLLVTMRSRTASGLPPVCRVDEVELGRGLVMFVEDSASGVDVVSAGLARQNEHAATVVDPDSLQELSEGRVGEVWIAGKSVAGGYWGQPKDITSQVFGAKLDGSPLAWFRTGDTGFIHDGVLYVVGRIKEMMVINGRNVFPQDIELTIEQVNSSFRSNGCAVFSLNENEKAQVVVVQEVKSLPGISGDELVVEIRKELAEQHGIFKLAAVLLVKPGRLPRTSSGKIQRLQCKKLYIENSLEALWSWCAEADKSLDSYVQPVGREELLLASIWSELLGGVQAGRNDSFFELGGDSLLALRLLSRIQAAFGVAVPLSSLFSHPVLSSLAELISKLPQSLLPEMLPADRGQLLPLSLPQQRLWFLGQLDPSLGQAYHIPAGLRFRGSLDQGVLQKSLDQLVARHEVLRTTFEMINEQVVQSVASFEKAFHLSSRDLSSEIQQREAIECLMAAEAALPFDLKNGPLIRGQLLRLAEDEHILLLTMHHIIADGWSVGVLLRELSAFYMAFSCGAVDPLPPLPLQYADYAVWQRDWLQGGRLERQVEFWKGQLAGAPVLLELPTDRPRPAKQSASGGRVEVIIDAELTQSLRQLGHKHGVTLFMILMTAWAAVLARLSGQAEVVIGAPTANRNRQELEGLVGFFVNTLALRVGVAKGVRIDELMSQVRGCTVAAQENQDLPFEKVVEIIQPPRSLAYSPLFQVMLTWQNNDLSLPNIPGLDTEFLDVDSRAVKCDLELMLSEVGDQIAGTLSYAVELFDAGTVERYRDYLTVFLRAMVEDAAQPVSGVRLLSGVERELLLKTWNQTHAPYSSDVCVHQLFERQCQDAPNSIAVVQGSSELTYSQLNLQANRLAHRLIAAGVGPDMRVALCMDRRPQMVVAMLAIMKAGGAYVPLDPSYPAARLRELLLDAQPILLMTDVVGRDAFADVEVETAVLCLDQLNLLSADVPQYEINPDPEALGLTPSHLAYVIYTSGSTGTPKGVMVEHHSVVNRLQWMQDEYALSSDDVVLQKTSFGFDVSVWEFFWTLLHGAKLVLAEPGAHKDPRALVDLINQEGVTTVHFVPSMLSAFLGEDSVVECAALRHIFLSGEALSPLLVRRCQKLLPNSALYNLYGPTEAAIDVTSWACPANFSGSMVPIGRPISNIQLYVLADNLEPVPQGVVGELFIGGVGVARGYLNRPDLSEERFLQDPFANEENARMYRTGDLVRYGKDGCLEFLGRNDYQVKVRGFRIELGEIEAKLLEQEAVRDAVVVATEGEEAPRLIAYVVPYAEGSCDSALLREHLSRKLPSYMLPVAFVQLAEMPLTASGKVDRKLLPMPDSQALVTRHYEAPQGEMEQELADLWSDLLGIAVVGRNDNFFELGGHSLLAVQLTARLRVLLGRDVSVTALFNAPTLYEFAELVTAAPRYANDQELRDLDAFMSVIEEQV